MTEPSGVAPPILTSTETADLDSELFTYAMAAVDGVARVVDAHLETGAWVPRAHTPILGQFDSGWPNLRPSVSHSDSDPVDATRLFSVKAGPQHPFGYRDVPELAQFLDYVSSRPDLVSRLSAGQSEVAQVFTNHRIVDLPLSIFDRGRALGLTEPTDIHGLYLQRERAWLAPELEVEYVIPLVLTNLELDESLVLGPTLRLEPISEADQLARARDYDIAGVAGPVSGAATHAFVLGGFKNVNPGPGPRLQQQAVFVPDQGLIEMALQALGILCDVPVGYAEILERPLGWADYWRGHLNVLDPVTTMRRYPTAFDDFGWLKTSQIITRATLDQLPVLLMALEKSPKKTQLAARRLSMTAMREDEDDQVIDACIGIEALLGDTNTEVTHRLAQRATAVLATNAQNPADPEMVYKLARAVYALRSALAHGDFGDKKRTFTLTPSGSALRVSKQARWLLAQLLQDQLTRPGGWTPKSLDALILARLATSIPAV